MCAIGENDFHTIFLLVNWCSTIVNANVAQSQRFLATKIVCLNSYCTFCFPQHFIQSFSDHKWWAIKILPIAKNEKKNKIKHEYFSKWDQIDYFYFVIVFLFCKNFQKERRKNNNQSSFIVSADVLMCFMGGKRARVRHDKSFELDPCIWMTQYLFRQK